MIDKMVWYKVLKNGLAKNGGNFNYNNYLPKLTRNGSIKKVNGYLLLKILKFVRQVII